ncbi:hypothetical protein ACOME3_009886 [Neoechinorhynchus agilis]
MEPSYGAPGKYWFGILPAPTRSQHPTYRMPPQRREQSPASARKRSGRSTLIARWASIYVFIPIAVETLGCLGKEADYFLFPNWEDAKTCHRRYAIQQLPVAANQRGDPTRPSRKLRNKHKKE